MKKQRKRITKSKWYEELSEKAGRIELTPDMIKFVENIGYQPNLSGQSFTITDEHLNNLKK